MRTRRLRIPKHLAGIGGYGPSIAAFALVFTVCAFPQATIHDPVPLLLERFLAGGGWIEIFGLSIYAAWLVDRLIYAPSIAPIRKTVWLLFSIVFFAQLFIGMAGVKQFLMTGTLHVPVPAVILAGPVFRGGGFFMPVLFCAVLLAVGPAWCSWLCYIGGWDNLAAQKKPAPETPGRYREWIRAAIALVVVLTALVLRMAGAPGPVAATIAVVFGVVGIGIMAFWSRKSGVMIHCTMYCPMGLIAAVAGKLNPFRMRISGQCTRCLSCAKVCRYGALEIENIRARKPGLACTLCGDCVSVCSGGLIDYRLFGLAGPAARKVFLVLVVALHAVFLGFARI